MSMAMMWKKQSSRRLRSQLETAISKSTESAFEVFLILQFKWYSRQEFRLHLHIYVSGRVEGTSELADLCELKTWRSKPFMLKSGVEFTVPISHI
ncbi:hypothetical protein L1887_16672 [Cichorium endivia]|nr:hypothetical protein L1887_16672 [Cichorium endivia]